MFISKILDDYNQISTIIWIFTAEYYVSIYIFIILIDIYISITFIVKTPLIIQLFSTRQSTYQYLHRLNITTQTTSDTYYDTQNLHNIQHTIQLSCIKTPLIYDSHYTLSVTNAILISNLLLPHTIPQYISSIRNNTLTQNTRITPL